MARSFFICYGSISTISFDFGIWNLDDLVLTEAGHTQSFYWFSWPVHFYLTWQQRTANSLSSLKESARYVTNTISCVYCALFVCVCIFTALLRKKNLRKGCV
ncbi:MAG: hypothetical protein NZZ41_08195, partial [Candidatus Dojkabacteria bacterium]|nr:hypothetical protein [Candidatus Dojkabacteria bacterium]